MFNVIKFKKGALALKMLALVAFTWFMLIGFGSLVKSQETELVMLQMIFRHGDRTPLHKYPNDPNDLSFWDKFGGYGVLTPNGKKQAYNYGSFLREKYSDFLSERFNENQVIVKSTNYNRTIKTVQSILSTLYKPKDSDYWDEQLAPLPTPMATLDSIWNLPNCSKYDKLMSQVLKSDEFSEASNYYKDTIEAVNKYSGKDHDLMTLCSFADTVYTEKNYNLTLPEWVLEHYDKVQKSCDTLYHFSYRTPEMAKYISGAILNDITMNLKRKVRRPVAPIELIMYSGHDTLVAPLIKLLELVENSTKPEFLASVIIELRRSKENGRFYVQALVKNNQVHEPIDLRKANIAGCDELCPFDDFERIVSNKIVKDLVSECASDINNV